MTTSLVSKVMDVGTCYLHPFREGGGVWIGVSRIEFVGGLGHLMNIEEIDRWRDEVCFEEHSRVTHPVSYMELPCIEIFEYI
jgi:hypothetical protein